MVTRARYDATAFICTVSASWRRSCSVLACHSSITAVFWGLNVLSGTYVRYVLTTTEVPVVPYGLYCTVPMVLGTYLNCEAVLCAINLSSYQPIKLSSDRPTVRTVRRPHSAGPLVRTGLYVVALYLLSVWSIVHPPSTLSYLPVSCMYVQRRVCYCPTVVPSDGSDQPWCPWMDHPTCDRQTLKQKTNKNK